MKRSHLSLFSLMIILTTSFSCFGMKKEKGCCDALKHAVRLARKKVSDPACSENGKDVELALLAASEEADSRSPKKCLTKKLDRKQLCVVVAALVASVGGFGAAGDLQFGGDFSSAAPAATVPAIPLSPPPPSSSIPLRPATPSMPLHKRPKKLFLGLVNGEGCKVLGVANVSNDEKTVRAETKARHWNGNSWCPYFTLMNFDTISCDDVDYVADASCMGSLSKGLRGGRIMIGDNLDSIDCQVQCRDDDFDHNSIARWATSVCANQKACNTYILSSPNNACHVNKTRLDGLECSFKPEQRFKNKKQNAARPTRERRPKQPKHRGR